MCKDGELSDEGNVGTNDDGGDKLCLDVSVGDDHVKSDSKHNREHCCQSDCHINSCSNYVTRVLSFCCSVTVSYTHLTLPTKRIV